MKKQVLLLVLILMLFVFESNAQCTGCWLITGNNVSAGDFLGELSGNNQDLKIKTEDAQNIDFYTSTGAGSFSNQRMTILGNTNPGYVGIGTAAPVRRLEIVDGSSDQLRLTFSGTTRTDFQTTTNGFLNIQPSSFRVGINVNPNSNTVILHVKVPAGQALTPFF